MLGAAQLLRVGLGWVRSSTQASGGTVREFHVGFLCRGRKAWLDSFFNQLWCNAELLVVPVSWC